MIIISYYPSFRIGGLAIEILDLEQVCMLANTLGERTPCKKLAPPLMIDRRLIDPRLIDRRLIDPRLIDRRLIDRRLINHQIH
jgi:hypothetical protein